MKKTLGIFILGAMLGAAAGFGAGLFVFPYLFPPPPAAEQVADRASRSVLAAGTFIHANPSDPVHWGKGTVEILDGDQRVVHLRPDFEVGPGPKYHLYLTEAADVRANGDFDETASIDLGGLRAFEGSQVYPIPDSVDLDRVGSVVVWCKAFGVLITPAALRRSPTP